MNGYLPRRKMLIASRGKVLILCAQRRSAQMMKSLNTDERQNSN
jgi:hypothetical protein